LGIYSILVVAGSSQVVDVLLPKLLK